MIQSKYQQHIIKHEDLITNKYGIYKIAALAGTGKTTTAKLLIDHYPDDIKWLVLVFNTSNKEEWRKWRQPGPHSYASFLMEIFPGYQWTWTGKSKTYTKSLQNLLNTTNKFDINRVKNIVNRFETTTDRHITDIFTSITLGIFENTPIIQKYTSMANRLWKAMINPKEKDFSLSESGGMKLMFLTKPKLNYDLVIWDEAQDIPDIHFGVMKLYENDATHVLFGDDYQTINKWRSGMSGKFNNIPTTASLPQTYRFGNRLSSFANSLMMVMENKKLKSLDVCMKGLPKKNTFVSSYTYFSEVLPFLRKHKTVFFLARSNRTLLEHILYYGLEIQKTHYIKCKYTQSKKDGENLIKNLKELLQLRDGKPSKYPSIWWKYNNWVDANIDFNNDEMTETQTELMEFVVKCKCNNVHTYIKLQEIIQNNSKAKKFKFDMSTVHGKKGSENGCVVMADDFLQLRITSDEFEEYCIFNTAITRAKDILFYPKTYNIIRKYQYAATRIERAWVRYRDWKKECTQLLSHKLPYELSEYIMTWL